MFSIEAKTGLNEYLSLTSASGDRSAYDTATASSFVKSTNSVSLLAGRLPSRAPNSHPSS